MTVVVGSIVRQEQQQRQRTGVSALHGL